MVDDGVAFHGMLLDRGCAGQKFVLVRLDEIFLLDPAPLALDGGQAEGLDRPGYDAEFVVAVLIGRGFVIAPVLEPRHVFRKGPHGPEDKGPHQQDHCDPDGQAQDPEADCKGHGLAAFCQNPGLGLGIGFTGSNLIPDAGDQLIEMFLGLEMGRPGPEARRDQGQGRQANEGERRDQGNSTLVRASR